MFHTDSTEIIRVIGDSYIGYLGCGYVVHVGENLLLYLYIQNTLNSFIWIPLVLVMFSPVSMATNGKVSSAHIVTTT